MTAVKRTTCSPAGAVEPSAGTLDLAIIGGGFSGLCTVWHLLFHEALPDTFRCALLEPEARLGAGLAYRTDCPQHPLNVRARGMSISESDTRSLVRWLAENAPDFSADDFIPRGVFRRYSADCFDQALAARPNGMVTVHREQVQAVALDRAAGHYVLQLGSGAAVRARIVVLAVGNLPARCSLDSDLLLSPWCGAANYRELQSLAIIGSGLTALDVILEAEATGFAGTYRVLSPHGRFPLPHRDSFSPVPEEVRVWAADLAARQPTLRQALGAFQEKRKTDIFWQDLVDALHRHASTLWRGFALADKRRFLRHLRTTWNIHLHRSCRKSIQTISALRAQGRLLEISALVTAVKPLADSGRSGVRLCLRAGASETILDVDGAVNATGLFTNVRRTDSPLLNQLLADCLVQPDELCLGLRATPAGRLLSGDGSEHGGLFAVGTLRRGEELECTAVPEIRRQVAVMTEEIVRLLGKG